MIRYHEMERTCIYSGRRQVNTLSQKNPSTNLIQLEAFLVSKLVQDIYFGKEAQWFSQRQTSTLNLSSFLFSFDNSWKKSAQDLRQTSKTTFYNDQPRKNLKKQLYPKFFLKNPNILKKIPKNLKKSRISKTT